MKPARTPTTHRLAVSTFGLALAAASLFGGGAAFAADGLSAGAVAGNAGEKPSHLGDECEVQSDASAKKVIAVNGTGGSESSVDACEKWDGSYYSAISVDGYVGYNGIAAVGDKREGDGIAPSGVFDMGYGFGVNAEPKQFHGSKYVKVTNDDVWVDGDAVKKYNTMQKKSAGYEGESMYQTPAYNYGQVIDYNTAATPGKGSAIFLHVNTGSGQTAGCVSVSQANLLKILKWEDSDSVEMSISQ